MWVFSWYINKITQQAFDHLIQSVTHGVDVRPQSLTLNAEKTKFVTLHVLYITTL